VGLGEAHHSSNRRGGETVTVPASVVVQGGTVYDGTGAPGRIADVVIEDDRVIGVVSPGEAPGRNVQIVDATGQAVAPGFVNVLSHAWGSIQTDPTGASDALQGVTTEIFGEAFSLGPGSPDFARLMSNWGAGGSIEVNFPRLSDGLSYLESRGVGLNVASFIGGHNLRVMGAGFDDRPLEHAELDRLCGVVEEEMQEGALGIGTALIYPPGRFAATEELVALSEVVGRYDGTYISHMRSEGDQFMECLDELLHIGRAASVRTEVYHLKAAGQSNWPKMKQAIDAIEAARSSGQAVSANMYPYTAGGTSLASSIPPKYHVGGMESLLGRLAEPDQRTRMIADISEPSDEFENLYLASGGGEGILFFNDLADGTAARGRRLSEVAGQMGLEEIPALLEIVAQQPGIGVAYFIIDEDNIRLGLSQPWVSVGSDAAAHQAITPFTNQAAHPRAYGTFARFLGRYCRDQALFSLSEGVRRMTSLPADNFKLRDRGRLLPGAFADVVVFDPVTIADRSTFVEPHQYAVGVSHVLVNGTPVVLDGGLTHATPGRRIRRAA
jgi:N-acyl-D-amino-acid deacylase